MLKMLAATTLALGLSNAALGQEAKKDKENRPAQPQVIDRFYVSEGVDVSLIGKVATDTGNRLHITMNGQSYYVRELTVKQKDSQTTISAN